MSHKQENEETKNNDDYTFLQEKIKDRPINKKKLVRKICFCSSTDCSILTK